jgi:acyl-CoA synthetase (AMP-forming)/AMP-acid ligase II
VPVRRSGTRVLLLNTYGVTEACCYQTAAVLRAPSGRESGGGGEEDDDGDDDEGEHARDGAEGSNRGLGKEEGRSGGGGSDGWRALKLPRSALPACAGAALPGCLVWVVQPGTLAAVPWGAEGEVCVGGPQVARGYWRRPELTAAKFATRNDAALGPPCSQGPKLLGRSFGRTREGGDDGGSSPSPSSSRARGPRELVYLTGDLGRWHPATDRAGAGAGGVAGWLELLGRADAQLKVRGRRVEAGEVEALFLAGDDAAATAAPALGGPTPPAAHAAAHGLAAAPGLCCAAPARRRPRLLQACAATVAPDGRLAVLAVPTAQVWAETVVARVARARAAAAATGPAANSQSDGNGDGDGDGNGDGDGGDVWEHEGLAVALRRRAAAAAPDALVPSVVAFARTLPLTATGKVALPPSLSLTHTHTPE